MYRTVMDSLINNFKFLYQGVDPVISRVDRIESITFCEMPDKLYQKTPYSGSKGNGAERIFLFDSKGTKLGEVNQHTTIRNNVRRRDKVIETIARFCDPESFESLTRYVVVKKEYYNKYDELCVSLVINFILDANDIFSKHDVRFCNK